MYRFIYTNVIAQITEGRQLELFCCKVPLFTRSTYSNPKVMI